jgi:hypothetical protein
VSIARTTPAQKPRGEHKSTFNCGFSEAWEDDISVRSRLRLRRLLRAHNAGIWFFAHADVKPAARENVNLHVNAVNNAGHRQNIPSPRRPLNLFTFPTWLSASGLHKSMLRAYITTIHVILDGNRLGPPAAGAQENLP